MADREALIEEFKAVAGTDNERARFYLESAAWNLETALGSFYEGEEAVAEPSQPQAEKARSPSTPPASPQHKKAQKLSGLINMLDQNSDSSDEEEGQAFYAGGSTHSGQQVLGPSRKKKSDMVAKLFKSAKEHGAEVIEGQHDGKKQKKATYSGTGYRLGETADDHTVIPSTKTRENKPRDVNLKMWKTGFTVDDGPLRAYEDPDNAEFLGAIKRSEIPLELLKEARGGEVYINMADHRHEDYVRPKTTRKAFSGAGHSLGSLAPNVVGQDFNPSGGSRGGATGGTSISPPSSATTNDPKEAEKCAQDGLKLDSQQPTTNIQIRLPDGSRLIIKLNHSHTVGDIRKYIETARPAYQSTSFALMTTFPHAELTNLTQSVSEAKLLNAALVVKTK